MKKLFYLMALVATLTLTGCYGRSETGNVGLRTDFNGTVNSKVEQEGLYTALMSHVDQYTLKEVAVNLENMTPKAHDNLSLKELDVTVYYKVISPQAEHDQTDKQTRQTKRNERKSFLTPAYRLVESIAKSEVADAVSH